MTHIKCSQCDLHNGHGAQVCEHCGMPLDQTHAERPDFPILFGGEAPRRSRTWKIILSAVIMLVIGGGAWAVYKSNSSRAKEAAGKRKPARAERTADERTRDAVLSCLAYPGFVGTKVSEQVLGPVHLEL